MSAPGRSADGSPVRVRRIPGAPRVAIRVVLPGGARRESVPGQSLVTGRMLDEGTPSRSWSEIAAAAEALGLNVSGYGGLESHGLIVDALAEHWRAALDLAAELVFEASFPADRVRWIVRHAAAELDAQADQADVLTARGLVDLLYSPHPKGRPLQGSRASLETLTSALCSELHGAALARGGWVVVAGDIDEPEVVGLAERRFAALPAPGPGEAGPPAPPGPSARRRVVETRARDQAHLFIGQLSVTRGDPDFGALEVAGVILGAGSGLSGRIPARIRDREGLAYAASADAVVAAGIDPGRLVAYVGTSPETVDRAERGVREELARLLADGVSEREVVDARSYLLGREPFRRETARQWADLAAQGRLLGLPLEDPEWSAEEIRAVDRAAVEAALRRHFDVERLGVVVGVPGAAAPLRR